MKISTQMISTVAAASLVSVLGLAYAQQSTESPAAGSAPSAGATQMDSQSLQTPVDGSSMGSSNSGSTTSNSNTNSVGTGSPTERAAQADRN